MKKIHWPSYSVFLGTLLAMFLVVYTIFLAAVPETAVEINAIQRVRLIDIAPEGWAFFTRNPKEESTTIYRWDSTKKLTKVSNIAGAFKNCMGLNRYDRLLIKEFSALYRYVKKENFVKIKGSIANNISVIDTMVSCKLPNDAKYPLLSGVYVIRQAMPIPWAWAKLPGVDEMIETKILKVDVINSNQFSK